MKRSHLRTRRLAAETLENRALLAGDISAHVFGGVLVLVGDSAANGVKIQASGDSLEVVGTEAGGAATTINGQTSFTANGVTGGLAAWLRNGNDSLVFGDGSAVTIPGTVVVGTGNGDDSISGSLNNGGRAILTTGAGGDDVSLSDSVLGSLAITTDFWGSANPGGDTVSLDGVQANRGAVIGTGGGDDTVDISGDSAFPLFLSIATGDGADEVNLIGTEDKAVSVGNALVIATGRGNDIVNAAYVDVDGVATISNLSGDATVTLDNVDATDGLFAWLGSGDDELTISKSSSARAGLGGGAGSDTLTLQDVDFTRLSKFSFEQ
jgi:hypothetical protein